MTSHLLVKEFMTKKAPSVVCGSPVSEVIDTLVKHHVRGVPVVSETNEVIGFISEHDCIAKLLQSSYYCEPEPSVNEVMSADTDSVSPNDTVVDLAQKMLTSRRQVFPVVEDKKLIGIISRSMVLVALKDNQQECSKLSQQ